MTAMSVAEPMTAEEYLAQPHSHERRWTELVGGELVVDPPLMKHQLICGEMFHEMTLWTRAEPGRGLTVMSLAVLISDHDVYEPDVHWYRSDRVPGRNTAAPYAVADLAVEVRSPSTWRYDIGAKRSGYERAGLPELWLVDSAADEILVFRRSKRDVAHFDVALEFERDDTLTSSLLPGFALKLSAVFGS